jgi:hypothetical protein
MSLGEDHRSVTEEYAKEFGRSIYISERDIDFQDPWPCLNRHVRLPILDIAKLAARHIRFSQHLKPRESKVFNVIFDRTILYGHLAEAIPYDVFERGGVKAGERYSIGTDYSRNTVKDALRGLEEQQAIVRWSPGPLRPTRYAINLLWTMAVEFGLGFQENWTPFEGREMIEMIVGKRSIRKDGKRQFQYSVLAVPDYFLKTHQRTLIIEAGARRGLRMPPSWNLGRPEKLQPMGKILTRVDQNSTGTVSFRITRRKK